MVLQQTSTRESVGVSQNNNLCVEAPASAARLAADAIRVDVNALKGRGERETSVGRMEGTFFLPLVLMQDSWIM